MADLGEGPGGAGPPLFSGKKKEIAEGTKAAGASKTPHPSLAQGLDTPL